MCNDAPYCLDKLTMKLDCITLLLYFIVILLGARQMTPQARAQECIGTKGRNADKLAHTDQLDPFQVIQRQFIIEERCKCQKLMILNLFARTNLSQRNNNSFNSKILKLTRSCKQKTNSAARSDQNLSKASIKLESCLNIL